MPILKWLLQRNWLNILSSSGQFATPIIIILAAILFRDVLEAEQQRARNDALQAYLNQMTSLISDEDSSLSSDENSELNADIQALARAHTLTVLRDPDRERKKIVIQFLQEIDLIRRDNPRITVDPTGFRSRKAILQDAVLSGADLRDLDLHNANLHGAILNQANLQPIEFPHPGTNLSGIDLSNAQLRGANLSNVYLQYAVVNGDSTIAANLRDADLTGANLTGADLTGADLTGAKVTNEQLAKASSLIGVTLSNGTKIETEQEAEEFKKRHE
ncbi:MAG: pentapeptide repeat-containing protein [Dehalococcoidia bacterium]